MPRSERHAGVAKADEPAYDYGAPIDQWLRVNAGKRITGITETTRKRIASEIAAGRAAGETLRQIARRVDKFYLEDIIPNRSMVIARTEVGHATNWAQDFIARDTEARGVPLEKEWISQHDPRTRDSHVDADGQRVPLDEPFDVGDYQLMFPLDESLGAGPEATIQCRCGVLHHVVDELRQKAAAPSALPPSPAEFARLVLGVEDPDVVTALAFARGVFGEGDNWISARKMIMKRVNHLRRVPSIGTFYDESKRSRPVYQTDGQEDPDET